MTLNETKLLGQSLGYMAREQDEIKQNMAADDPEALLIINNRPSVSVLITCTAIRKTYKSDSFIIDHPVNSQLDNTTLVLDGGYIEGAPELTVPITVPITFSGATAEILFTDSSAI